MWIVRLALDRPYTFVVVAILIALFGSLSIKQMSVDIFPRINIPVLTCVWNYTGLIPVEMERRITNVTERAATTTVTGIEHIESLSLVGVCVIKLYLHQDANAQESLAELAAICQTMLKQMPPGVTPPLVTAFSATDIPVMQLCISSKTIPETKLFDFANNFVRTQLATVQGAALPWPYGGAARQIMVDIDPQKLASKGVSAADVALALNQQNIILPAGTAKFGTTEYYVMLNSSPTTVEQLNEMPVKQVGDATILMKDVAQIHDGLAVQTNVVNESGSRAILQNVVKLGAASTIDVVNRVKAQIPAIENILPAGVDLRILNDQSIFVQEAVDDVVKEGLTAAGLTAILMLLLLGDWQSTVIVAISIPLSVLAGLIILKLTGQTLNTMTLGGFALAVGMLVDDATVEVENIHRHLELMRSQRLAAHEAGVMDDKESTSKWMRSAILEAAAEIAAPAFISTISICIVFTPVFLLTEPARSLFYPLALAVCGSMLASYFLSRTVVPVMAKYMLASHAELHHKPRTGFSALLSLLTKRIDSGFDKVRHVYHSFLAYILLRKWAVVACTVIFMAISFSFVPFLGEDFFPTIDAGVLRMHVGAPRGMRVEETERLIKRIEADIAQWIPADQIDNIADIMGIPNSGLNLSSSDSVNYTEADGEILVTLVRKHDKPSSYYRKMLREKLPKLHPECVFFFQPADIVTQILNAGLAAPIDVQVRGQDMKGNYALAEKIRGQIEKIPGAVDVHIKQSINGPVINVNVDRQKAAQLGYTQRDIAGSMLVSLSSSFQTAPNFWVNPKNGVNYSLAVQTPQRLIASMSDLSNTVVTNAEGSKSQLLGNLASFDRSVAPTVINHYNVQPVIDILANVEGTDLNSVAQKVQTIVGSYKGKLPHGVFLDLRGQMVSMQAAFSGLLTGMLFALVLVYLLLVVNFQSWVDPLIILMAIPGALSGIVWALFLTQTPFSVPALMGAIMSIGVASANSILVVSFAREKLAEGLDPMKAALEAGSTRFRPVLMTAAAMIIGMVPMAIGSGSGGAQNAPLGRAVIGGLVVATFFTLLWVPLIFTVMHRNKNRSFSKPKPVSHSPADIAHLRE
ncbi:MAG: efflux RND transporter permease subunit [Candidatus Melainabacteria bacterium]|nr:MAG: efflux RND transporter permease subunit [Candidatus Melainabacteria bacterium]